jgi:uncharacterized phage infection (PIP) family protein YhgE
MATPRATTGPTKEPTRDELIAAFQLETAAAIKVIKDSTLVELHKLATKVGQLADLSETLENRVNEIQRTFTDYEFRFQQALKEANEILRTSVAHSESAKNRVDVFEKLAERQTGSERRDIAALQHSVGQLRDTVNALGERQNSLQGYVSERLALAGIVHEYVNEKALQHRPPTLDD